MDVLTTASTHYITTFTGFISLFTAWGKWIFVSLLVINISWLSLWHAFSKHSLAESMPEFIKHFFVSSLFFTIMMNPSWLLQVLKTAQFMGHSLTHAAIDPSSLIEIGIALGNKVISPVANSSLLTAGFTLVVLTFVYMAVLFVFISVALELAETLIVTSALISISSFFLSFAALQATTQIARQTLDVILANCVKLLGIYLVVAAGSQTLTYIATTIPTSVTQLKQVGFDPYAWLIAATMLFWKISKSLPNQMAKIVSNAIQESRGSDVAALAVSAVNLAKTMMPGVNIASQAIQGVAKIAGSSAYNAGAHFNQTSSSTGSLMKGLGAAVGGSALDLGKSVSGKVSEHFKDIASKMAGGSGAQQAIRSVPERMYAEAKDVKNPSAFTETLSSKAASPSHTAYQSKPSPTSRPKK